MTLLVFCSFLYTISQRIKSYNLAGNVGVKQRQVGMLLMRQHLSSHVNHGNHASGRKMRSQSSDFAGVALHCLLGVAAAVLGTVQYPRKNFRWIARCFNEIHPELQPRVVRLPPEKKSIEITYILRGSHLREFLIRYRESTPWTATETPKKQAALGAAVKDAIGEGFISTNAADPERPLPRTDLLVYQPFGSSCTKSETVGNGKR